MGRRLSVMFFVVCCASEGQPLTLGSDTLEGRARDAMVRGETVEALTLFQKSIAARGQDDPSLPDLLDELAELQYRTGRLSGAERSTLRALTIRRHIFGPDHPSVATSMNNLGEVLFAESKYKDAEQYYYDAVALTERETPPDPERLGKFLANLGKAFTARGRDGEAGQVLGRALAIWTRLGIPSEEAATLGMLGVLKRQRGNYTEAEQMFRGALDRLPPGHQNAITARIDLADVLRLRKRYDESDHQFRLAIALLEVRLGREHPDRAAALTLYASLLRETHRGAEAKPLLEEAKRIRQAHARANGTGWVVDARIGR